VIGPLHAAEDRRLGAGSNGTIVQEDSGEKAYDLGIFVYREEDYELEAEEEDRENNLKYEGLQFYQPTMDPAAR
jgi:hypothetical protein